MDNKYNEKICVLFTSVLTAVNTMIPPSTGNAKQKKLYTALTFPPSDIASVYENSSDDDQEFVQNLALFLTSFLSSHLKVSKTVHPKGKLGLKSVNNRLSSKYLKAKAC